MQKVIGLAGHIDHGKTALVKALTGVDTDRLAEEKRRGVTIDIGIAFYNEETTIIDVPGHERFIKNMVTGVSTVDLALLVIAADDGIMPQTREHSDILKLLGVKHLIVALNKIDLVEPDWVELVTEDVRSYISELGYPDAAIVPVSAAEQTGIQELRTALDHGLQQVQERTNSGLFRLPIDRVFSVKGFGTVVTGTVLSHELKVGQSVELYPQETVYTVRGIQSHHQDVERVRLGDRAALNLASANIEELGRGSFLGTPGLFRVGQAWLAEIDILPHWTREMKEADRVHVHVGTGKQEARVHLLEGNKVLPGQRMLAQLFFDDDLAAAFGERTILRFESPEDTLGSARLLWPWPQRMKKSDERVNILRGIFQVPELDQLHKLLMIQRGPLTRREIAAHLSLAESKLQVMLTDKHGIHAFGDRYQLELNYANTHEAIVAQLQAAIEHDSHHGGFTEQEFKDQDKAMLRWVLQAMLAAGEVQNRNQRWQLIDQKAQLAEEEAALQKELTKEYVSAGFAPPLLNEVRSRSSLHNRVCEWMVKAGELVQIEKDFFLLSPQRDEFIEVLRSWFSAHETLTVPEAKELVPTTRKFMLPLLNHAEKKGFILRQGDVRIWIGER